MPPVQLLDPIRKRNLAEGFELGDDAIPLENPPADTCHQLHHLLLLHSRLHQ